MGNFTVAYLNAKDRARGADPDQLLELLREAYEELYDAREACSETADDLAKAKDALEEAESEVECLRDDYAHVVQAIRRLAAQVPEPPTRLTCAPTKS